MKAIVSGRTELVSSGEYVILLEESAQPCFYQLLRTAERVASAARLPTCAAPIYRRIGFRYWQHGTPFIQHTFLSTSLSYSRKYSLSEDGALLRVICVSLFSFSLSLSFLSLFVFEIFF